MKTEELFAKVKALKPESQKPKSPRQILDAITKLLHDNNASIFLPGPAHLWQNGVEVKLFDNIEGGCGHEFVFVKPSETEHETGT